MSDITVDVAVIGAGPAGMAAGVGAKKLVPRGLSYSRETGI